MNLFYQPNIGGETVRFEAEESRHILRVLRKEIGDQVFVTDGMGKLLICSLISDHPKHCEAKVIHTERKERRGCPHLHLAVAPTKNIGRYEWFLEKATEIGVDEITPLICQNSERNRVNTERQKKVLISAMKQSLKVFLPVLNPTVPFLEYIEKTYGEQKFIAYLGSEDPAYLAEEYNKGKTTIVLIGPEGDFTPKEVEAAFRAEYIPVSLGKSRLRTETAGIVACHTISLMENV